MFQQPFCTTKRKRRGVPVLTDFPRVEYVQSNDWESLLRRDEATLNHPGSSNNGVFEEKQMELKMMNYGPETAATGLPWEMANNEATLTAYESNMWGISQPYHVGRYNARVQDRFQSDRWSDGGKSVLWQSFGAANVTNPNNNTNNFGSNQGSGKSSGGKLSALLSLFPVMKHASRNQPQAKEPAMQNNRSQSRLQVPESGVPMALGESGYPFNTGVGSYAMNDQGDRRRKLDQLLITPVVTMKGIAYDDNKGWWDFDTERDFHQSCTDFLAIVALAGTQETASKIKEFLTSDLLDPIYSPAEYGQSSSRLNHFQVFWNVMHQLPFYVKKFDQRTKEGLIWFYEVGIRDTLPCGECKKHYTSWIRDRPVANATGGLESMNMWMFQLHDHVNWRSKKPHFKWAMYKRRWAPKHQRFNAQQAPKIIRNNGSGMKVNKDPKDVVGAGRNRMENQERTALQPMLSTYDRDVPVYPADIPVYPAADVQVPTTNYDSVYPQYDFGYGLNMLN